MINLPTFYDIQKAPSQPTKRRTREEWKALYGPVARQAALKYGVPEVLFDAQIDQESGYQADLGANSAGAIGIAQIVPRYHAGVDPRNPEASLDYAAKLMRSLYDKYGSWELALAAYNAGGPSVDKAGPGIPNIPETQGYVRSITAAAQRAGWTPGATAAPASLPRFQDVFGGPQQAPGGVPAAQPGLGTPKPTQAPNAPIFGTPAQVIQQGIDSALGPSNFVTELGRTLQASFPQSFWGKQGGRILEVLGQAPPINVTARILSFSAIPGRVIESALSEGQGFEDQFSRTFGLRKGGSFSPAAIAAGTAAMILDPMTYIGVGTVRRAANLVRGLRGAAVAEVGAIGAERHAVEAALAREAAQAFKGGVTREGAAPMARSNVEFYTRMQEITGKPTHVNLRDASGKVVGEQPLAAEMTEQAAKAARQAEELSTSKQLGEAAKIEYVDIHDPTTGLPTGERIHVGERGFTELMNMELAQRLEAIAADPAPFIKRLTASSPTVRQMQNMVRRISSVIQTGKEIRPGDSKKLSELVTTYLGHGGNPRLLPEEVVNAVRATHPQLIDESPRLVANRAREEVREIMGRSAMSDLDLSEQAASHARPGFSDLRRDFMRYFIRQSDTVMREMGPAGQELVKRANSVENEFQTRAGAKMAALLKVKGTDAEWDRVRAFRQGDQTIQLTPTERNILEITSQYFDRETLERAAPFQLPVQVLDNYWAQRPDWTKLGWTSGESEVVRKLMERGMSKPEAEELWRKVILPNKGGRPFGNLERERHVLLPDYFRKPAKTEFIEYILGFEKRLAEIKHYGLRDEKMSQFIMQVADQDQRFASQWFHFIRGNNPWRDGVVENFATWAMDKQAAAKLPLAVISNSMQTFNNLLITDMASFYRGLKTATRNPEEAIDFATRAGVVMKNTLSQLMREQMGGIEEGIGGKILKWTGFNRVEQGNRINTVLIGREWFFDLAKKAHKTEAQRQLQRIGFSQEDITRIALGKHTEQDVMKTARWLVEKTQFLARPRDFPMMWSNPWVRMATLFKKFSYKQGQLLWDAVATEGIRKFNPINPGTYYRLRPLAVLGAIFPLLGEVVGDSRVLIRGVLTDPQEMYRDYQEGGFGAVFESARQKRPQFKELGFNMPFLRRYTDNIGWMGGLGLASDMFRALWASPGRMHRAIAGFAGGPIAADAADLVAYGILSANEAYKWAAEGGQQAFGATRRFGSSVAGTLPFGQLLRNLPFFKSPEMEKRMLRSQYYEAEDQRDAALTWRIAKELQEKFGERVSSSAVAQHRAARSRKEKQREKFPAAGKKAINWLDELVKTMQEGR